MQNPSQSCPFKSTTGLCLRFSRGNHQARDCFYASGNLVSGNGRSQAQACKLRVDVLIVVNWVICAVNAGAFLTLPSWNCHPLLLSRETEKGPGVGFKPGDTSDCIPSPELRFTELGSIDSLQLATTGCSALQIPWHTPLQWHQPNASTN